MKDKLGQAFSNIVGKLEYNNDMSDEVNDLLTLTRYVESTNKSLRDVGFKNLYVMVCSLAMATVASMDRTRRSDLWVRLKQSFNDVIANYPSTSRANEMLFAYVGTSSMGNWPHGFLAYVEDKQRSKPTARFKRDHQKNVRGSDGDDMMQLWYQGFQIEEEADQCK